MLPGENSAIRLNLNCLERSLAGHFMRLPIVAAVALLVFGVLSWWGGYAKDVHGELRCEGRGAVIINVDGKDYAVNGMASRRYPPIEQVWNSATRPEAYIGRILSRGLTPMRLVELGGRRVIFNVQSFWSYDYDRGNRNCCAFVYCSGASGRLGSWRGFVG